MDAGFVVLTTRRFDREFKKLAAKHEHLLELLQGIIGTLQADPFNRTRQFPIRKLEAVSAGDGQYRIRAARFRFRYDIETRAVYLKARSLRREDSY